MWEGEAKEHPTPPPISVSYSENIESLRTLKEHSEVCISSKVLQDKKYFLQFNKIIGMTDGHYLA